MHSVNKLWEITDDNDSFIAVLANFCPMELSGDAISYQLMRSQGSNLIRLSIFNPDGPTFMLYMWLDLENRFDDVTTKYFIFELTKSGAYLDKMNEA